MDHDGTTVLQETKPMEPPKVALLLMGLYKENPKFPKFKQPLEKYRP